MIVRNLIELNPSARSLLIWLFRGLAAGLLWWSLRRAGSGRGDALRLFGLFGCLVPLLVASSWLHYHVHLPIVWLMLGRAALGATGAHRWTLAGAVILSAALANQLAVPLLGEGLFRNYAREGWMAASNLIGLAGLVLVLWQRDAKDAGCSSYPNPS